MRSGTAAALLVATIAVVFAAPAAAGGARAGSLRSGGAGFGDPLPVPDKRPIASRLTVTPRVITAGDPTPVVRLRVRQRGVVRVRADRRGAAARQPAGGAQVARAGAHRSRAAGSSAEGADSADRALRRAPA